MLYAVGFSTVNKPILLADRTSNAKDRIWNAEISTGYINMDGDEPVAVGVVFRGGKGDLRIDLRKHTAELVEPANGWKRTPYGSADKDCDEYIGTIRNMMKKLEKTYTGGEVKNQIRLLNEELNYASQKCTGNC